MNYIHDISGKQFCGFDDKPFLKVGKQKCGFYLDKILFFILFYLKSGT